LYRINNKKLEEYIKFFANKVVCLKKNENCDFKTLKKKLLENIKLLKLKTDKSTKLLKLVDK
jgi:hypothetical protein